MNIHDRAQNRVPQSVTCGSLPSSHAAPSSFTPTVAVYCVVPVTVQDTLTGVDMLLTVSPAVAVFNVSSHRYV